MPTDLTAEQIEALEYLFPRKLPTGEWAALGNQMFTTSLVVGIDRIGYRTRFCYEHFGEALIALAQYDGTGDPAGLWIKEKGRNERLNPEWAKANPDKA